MNSSKIGFRLLWALALCLCAPVFLYAQAQHVSLGANVSSATLIADTVEATVTDGTENYFKIEAEHLPATVCYFPQAAFGPIPTLISVIGEETLSATMIAENCRMGWRWILPEAGEEETVRYLYFSSHEESATAEIRPYVFTCPEYDITLPDVSVCDAYKWGDTTIYDSGTYTRHLTATNGCDSTVTLTVTIRETSDPTNIYATAYDKYTWRGITVEKSGYVGTWNGTNAAECDSVVNMFVTIKHLLKDTIHQSICSSKAPYEWRGKQYSESGLYTTDTVYSTSDMDTLYTLDLTVKPSTTEEIYKHVDGDSYTGDCGVYTRSGDYTCVITNHCGCDSTIILHLTLDVPVSYDTVYFCHGYNTVHEEEVSASLVRRYLEYTYEAPSAWDYKEGFVVDDTQRNKLQLDLHRVEENLYNHYVGALEAVKTISWSYCPYAQTTFSPVTVTAEPQWFESGELMMYVRFTCGHDYTEKTTIIRNTEAVDAVNDGQEKVQKVLIDGQLYILRGDAKYNIFGSRVE